ncbi:solute carrier family 23 protein [Candidatus Poriferisodalis sp.]|uniref:solute carrier family 23 protein n=1 Tax=Candidatus Poriferisodalis sp. TaxID=3101277 RepID=UPI003B01A7DC
MAAVAPGEEIAYEPDENCSFALSLGMGIQGVVIALAPTVLTMSLFVQSTNLSARQATWSVIAGILVCGVATAVSAARLGPVGGGHNVLMAISPSYLAVAILAVNSAGPQTLASLVVVTAVFQLALARWLHRLSRIITPTVSGVVVMLIAIGVMQVVVERVGTTTTNAPDVAAPVVALIAVLVAAVLALRAKGLLRLWSPIIAIVAATIAAVLFGLYDSAGIDSAAWLAVPQPEFPGLDLTPGADFWALLPLFVVVSLAVTIKAMTTGVVIQRVSQRDPGAADYRLVQGTVNTVGVGSLLGGLAGTLSVGTMDATSISFAQFTGVASRRVGYCIGAMLIALALTPKLTAVLLTVPSAVASGYLLIIMGLLFVEGLRSVLQDGLRPQKAVVIGVAVAVGVGLQGSDVIGTIIGGAWGTLLSNGMVVGTLIAILLTAYLESSGRRRRLETALNAEALPQVDEFLAEIAEGSGWDEVSANRLRLVGEESLLSLMEESESGQDPSPSRLVIVARPSATSIELQLRTSADAQNLEDRLTFVSERAPATEEHTISLRLLRHFASTVRHRKYSGVDIITVEVERVP